MLPNSTLLQSVDAAVSAAEWLTPADGAAVHWLRHLAQSIDQDPENIPKLGKLFESALSVLGLTIAGRSVKPENPRKVVNRLDEIKQKAIARVAESPGDDTTASRPVTGSGHRGDGGNGGDAVVALASKSRTRNRKD